MGKNLNRALKLAEKIVGMTEHRVRRELDALAKSGIISTKDAKQILKAAVKEAKKEQQRVRAFITAELKRELAKAKPVIKNALAKKKKQFAAYRKKRKH